jgi:hypothetical protein
MMCVRAGNRLMQLLCALPLLCAIAACGSGGSDGGGTPPPPPPSVTLTVAKAGSGTGTITSNPAGIDCGTTCTVTVSSGTVVTLTAAPASSNAFTDWGGACAAGSATCAVTITADQTVTATFNRSTATPRVIVTIAGTGAGSVTCSANGAAPAPCGTYSWGSQISLLATPNGGSVFAGWSGGCSGSTSPCTIAQLTADTAVTATFTQGTPPPASVRLGAAHGYTLAVHADGRVLSIGSGMTGGESGTVLPGTAARVITGLNGISSVLAGYLTQPNSSFIPPTFAIATDGSVRGWGDGVLGASVTGHYGDIVDTPILVPAAGQATALSVCHGLDLPIVYALHSDGTVSYTPAISQIDLRSTRTSTTQTIPSLTSVISMSKDCTGDLLHQTVVVKSDGTVWSLTLSETRVGGPPPFTSTTTYRVVVAQVSGLPAIAQASCGGLFSGFCLASATDGTVWAWGDNNAGQLGDGTVIGRTIPIQVPGLASIAKVIAGPAESYAIDTHGGVFSWGHSSSDGVQGANAMILGRTTTHNAWVPGLVPLTGPATALAASGTHAVVLLSNGTVWSWGINTRGELGVETSGQPSALPIQALGLDLN